MPVITFDEAKTMATDCEIWMNKVSQFILDPTTAPPPTDIYATQKLAFEIDKKELEDLLDENPDKIVGILGYEAGSDSLSIIFVGTDSTWQPSASNPPRQTWPMLKKLSELSDVLNTYLKI